MTCINNIITPTTTLSDFTQDIKMWLAENFIAKYSIHENTIIMDFLNGKKYLLTIVESK